MEVKFRRPKIDSGWRKGMLLTVRAPYDPSIDTVMIKDNRTGGMYAIHREHVQKLVRGPRGGTKWMPL